MVSIPASFEPMAEASLKLLTLRTVFLVLLASGSRRGDILYLSGSEIAHDQHWKYISLRPVPGSLAKTELRASGASVFDGVRIQSLTNILSPSLPEDRSLCPVRAFKFSLQD